MPMRTLFGLMALAWLAAWPAAAAQAPLFAEDAPALKITLTAPFGTMVRNAKYSTDPVAATMTVSEGAGPAQSFAIQLRARGHTRRQAGYCTFPPLLLRFDKASVKGTPFHGQKKIKLVTYCQNKSDYEQRIVLEQLVYRLGNVLTPLSFRVRAADVTYRTGEADKGVTRFGFLIEDPGDMADRNDREAMQIKTHEVSLGQLDARAAARTALFEFMIGNLDWEFLAAPAGMDCCHNVFLLAARGSTAHTAQGVVPAPYDFDYSGFVDSPYAGPAPGIPIDSLRERFYRGYCATNGEVGAAVQEFRAHKAELMRVVSGEPRLEEGFRSKTLRFMDSFFAMLDDPGQVEKNILKHCR
jgi:hypothetical protein